MNQKLARFTIFLLGFFCLSFALNPDEKQNRVKLLDQIFTVADKQYTAMLGKLSKDMKLYPRSLDSLGNLKSTSINDWTGGFWPGNLWQMYEYTKDPKYKTAAIKWTESLNEFQYNARGHDLGFMMYCSYGNGFRLTNNQKYKEVLIQSAKSLATRYNPRVGSIKSWNQRLFYDQKTIMYFPVIIDNLMNLELLFFASKVTGDNTYRDIAVQHGLTTLKNHIRPDFSSFHVLNYDSETGELLNKVTGGGIANNSTWARGQAWGIYGFTMLYRETRDPRFLKTARGMADYYLNKADLPKDMITYWDLSALDKSMKPPYTLRGQKMDLRDASAAAITCSALFELSTFLDDEGSRYFDAAEKMLKSLASPAYLAKPGENGNFLLMHSVGSFPHNDEMDKPIIYADYYFLEAALRYRQFN